MKPKLVIVVALMGLSVGGWIVLYGRAVEPTPPVRADDNGAIVAAPEFNGVTAWLNTKPLKLADQKGKVVVVHFWTNG
jgi:hypothetical protein